MAQARKGIDASHSKSKNALICAAKAKTMKPHYHMHALSPIGLHQELDRSDWPIAPLVALERAYRVEDLLFISSEPLQALSERLCLLSRWR